MSETFDVHIGRAAVLLRDNVDTDQIIPSREMKSVGRDGLSDGLFAGWRYLEPGGRDPNPDFVLNRPEQSATSILISGANFGCGSSREHAVWALKEFGIRAIIAKSFGEIFHGNCIRNGVLPITLSGDDIERLARVLTPVELAIDLPMQTVKCTQLADWQRSFDVSPIAKRMIGEGLNPIDLTLSQSDQIEAFLARDAVARPWVYSAA